MKKNKSIKILLVIISLFLFGLFFSIFDNGNLKFVNKLIITLIVVIFFYLMITLNFYIRTLEMKKVAKILKLNFNNKLYFYKVTKNLEKINKINGKIKGKEIEIIDYVKMINGIFSATSVPMGYTKIKFGNSEMKIKGHYWKFVHYKDIIEIINKLKNGNSLNDIKKPSVRYLFINNNAKVDKN